MNLSILKTQCLRFLDDCIAKPKLFHIHFTLKEDIDELIIDNNQYKVHKLYLPGSGLQYLTNIKVQSFQSVLEHVEILINSQYEFIGYKIEALFRTSDIIEDKISKDFEYIEIHTNNKNSLLSWSFKRNQIAFAKRFKTVDEFKEFVKGEVFNKENYNEYLTEIACFDYWTYDLEKDWKATHCQETIEHIKENILLHIH